jgi:23S rRNA pseudouridine2605 synthase
MSPRKARPSKPQQAKPQSPKKDSDSSESQPALQRINKVLAAAGLGSRRQVDELIEQGRVEIDGQVVTQVGVKVDLANATIVVDGEELKQHRPVYFALHKPEGVLCTNRDPQGRPRVIDFVPNQHRLFPVGRLDASSTGLILLTNDGELAQQLAHPKHEIPKRYAVVVVGQVELDALKRLERGIYLAEGKAQVDQAKLKKVRKSSTEIEITLARTVMARRIAATFGYSGLIVELMLGWIAGWDTESVLVRGFIAMLVASLVGWTAGTLACDWHLGSDPSPTSTSR